MQSSLNWLASQLSESVSRNPPRSSGVRPRYLLPRAHGNSWFNKSARERFGDIIDQTRDMALQTIRESWHMYHSPELADKPETRAVYLGRVQMEQLRQVHENIERQIEEARQKGKISAAVPPPFQAGTNWQKTTRTPDHHHGQAGCTVSSHSRLLFYADMVSHF